MKCKLSTVNGWCGIFNRSCKQWANSQCKFIKKAYRQGRVEAEYFINYYEDNYNNCLGCKHFDEEHTNRICYDCKRAYRDRYEE